MYTMLYSRNDDNMNLVGNVRYNAYRSVDAIPANDQNLFLDSYDAQINCQSCLITQQTRPVAAIRASIYSAYFDFAPIPCLEVYRDDVKQSIGLDYSIVESNRFVVHSETAEARQLFKLQFKFIILNALKFDIDYIVTAVRPKHIPFYKRILMYPISQSKRYPGIDVDMVLLAGSCKNDLSKVINQDPLFNISQDEIDRYWS